jgi:alanyl-tRNA synthetase
MDNYRSNLLQCQQNSYQKEGFSLTLSCRKDTSSDNFKVLLNNSVLYAEGGGQPYDLGTVADVPVLNVLKPEGISTKEQLASVLRSGEDPSLLQLIDNINLNTIVEVEVPQPLPVNKEVRCVVDWKRRYDFMQQHTAQHLFSAIADRLFAAPTVGWSLGAEFVTVDLQCNPILTTEQLLEIEIETNRMIRENPKVNYKVYSKEQFEENLSSLKNNKDSSDVTNGDVNHHDHNHEFSHFRGEVKGAALQMSELRLVSIDGIDLNPCGGTHLSSLSEISLFKIVDHERDVANQIVKVRFLAGERAISYFQHCLLRESSITQLLSCKPTDFVTVIDKTLKEKKDLTKKYETYNEELAFYYGKSLLSRAVSQFEDNKSKGLADNKTVIIVDHRFGADLKFLLKAGNTLFAEKFPNDMKVLFFLSGDDNMPLPLASANEKGDKKGKKDGKGPSEDKGLSLAPGRTLKEGPFILFGEVETLNLVKDEVLKVLAGKGGGRPGRLQGYANSLSGITQLSSLFDNLVQ